MPTVVYKPTLTMMGLESLVPAIQMYQPARRNAVRVQVKRGDTWHDITSRVHRGQVRHNNDDPIALLDLTLLNGTEYDSLAPRVKTSPLNRDANDDYAPLLDRYNEILVEAAFSVDGSTPTNYVPVFHGILGDGTTTEHDAEAGVVVHLQARDLAKRLQDDLIREPITYRDMYASQIIQALLDERFGEGAITLNGLGVDDFYIDEVTFEYVDTWQAIQSFCEQSDKDVRYMLDEVSGQFLLTYWTPSTAMVPVWSIDASDIIRESLETSDASLRHAVEVRYIDASGERQSEYVEDTTNQKPNEPLRVALIEEGDTSAIRDQAAALRFANAVLSALKTEPATDSLQVPFTPYMRIYDVIQVANTGVRSEPELYAIDELRLNFSADEWWTEVVASESVKVRHEVWLEKEAKRGVKSPFTPGDWTTETKPPAPEVTLTTGLDDVSQATTAYIQASWTRPDWRYIDRYMVRIRQAGSSTYQYQETRELSATFHGLVGNREYGVQVAVVDGRGVVGPWSDEETKTAPKDQTAPATPSDLVVTSHLRGVQASITPNTEPDLRRYVWEKNVDDDGWEVFARDLVTDRVIPAEAGEEVAVRVSAEDWSGNVSDPSEPKSAVAGQANTTDIAPGAVTGLQVKQVSDLGGVSTTVQYPSWDDIPNFEVTFSLDETTIVLMYMTVEAAVSHDILAAPSTSAASMWRMALNGSGVDGSQRAFHIEVPSQGYPKMSGTVGIVATQVLAPGNYTLKGQFSKTLSNSVVEAYSRTLGALILKR